MSNNPANIVSVSSLSALKAIPSAAGSQISLVYMSAYSASVTGADGFFAWNGSSSATGNDGTIVTPNDSTGNGRWIRLYDTPINVRWFGATGSTSDNQYTSILAAYNAAISATQNLYIPKGGYRFDTPLDLTYTTFMPNFIGEGSGTPGSLALRGSWLGYAGSNGVPYAIRFTDAGTTVAPTFKNLAISGGGSERCILNQNNSFMTLENINIESANNSSTSCLLELRNSTSSTNNCEHNSLINVRMQDYKGSAIRLTNQVGAVNTSHNYLRLNGVAFAAQQSGACDIDIGGTAIGSGDGGAQISRSSISAFSFVSNSGSFIRVRNGSGGIVDTFFNVQGEAANPPSGTRIQVDGTSASFFALNWWGGINIVSAGNPQYPIMADSLSGATPYWSEFPSSGWPSASLTSRLNRLSGLTQNSGQAVAVSTSATTIAPIIGNGSIFLIRGINGSTVFEDYVYCAAGSNPSTLASGTGSGTPDTRTYTRSTTNLQLAMSAGTYAVQSTILGAI